MKTAETLLNETPELKDTPAHIEALELSAFDVSQELKALGEQISEAEETATIEAHGKGTNDQQRRAARKDILRADETYNVKLIERTELERTRLRLTERAARLRREYRLALLNIEASQQRQ
jgi:hypothetical protein